MEETDDETAETIAVPEDFASRAAIVRQLLRASDGVSRADEALVRFDAALARMQSASVH